MNTNITGAYNTCVGKDSDVATSALTNAMSLGYAAVVNASNKVVIGNGSVTTIGGYANWTNYSDLRLKENIRYTDALGLDFIMKLNTASYNYKNDENKVRRDGLIAQDVQQALKELNIEFSGLIIDDDAMKTMNLSYDSFVIPLINAVKEQQAMIEKQQKQIDYLMSRMESLARK